MKRSDPTKEELEMEFEYRDGELWRKSHIDRLGRFWPEKRRESVVNDSDGYCIVTLRNRRNVKYHRVVWILNRGEIPEGFLLDHINGDKVDNRLDNLRLVSARGNCQNRCIHRKGKLAGVNYRKKENKWRARICFKGKRVHLGDFQTELEAHNAYIKFLEEKGLD